MNKTLPPPKPRRTRREMQDDTRGRLMEAALALFDAEGVGATSIRGICQYAGFTQGAFYSNFATKEDLLLALVETHTQRLVREIGDSVARTRGLSLDAALRRLAKRLGEIAQDPAMSLLLVELQLLARRDGDFAARLAPLNALYIDELERLTKQLLEPRGLTGRLPPRALASAMMALWSGALVQGATQREASAQDILRVTFGALTRPSSETAEQ